MDVDQCFNKRILRRIASIVASALLLSVIIIATAFAAILSVPNAAAPPTVISVSVNSSATTKSTSLFVRLSFPNGTIFTDGRMYAGSIRSQVFSDKYEFSPIDPGTYDLNLGNVSGVYLPPSSVKVLQGVDELNVTVYPLSVFRIVETPNLSLNNTRPGPEIIVKNSTAVTFIVNNNTTLIQNLAVVSNLYNTNYSSVLFDSLSSTINAGGTVNQTFVVDQVGYFYYTCLIGNDASTGEFGLFVVTLP